MSADYHHENIDARDMPSIFEESKASWEIGFTGATSEIGRAGKLVPTPCESCSTAAQSQYQS